VVWCAAAVCRPRPVTKDAVVTGWSPYWLPVTNPGDQALFLVTVGV